MTYSGFSLILKSRVYTDSQTRARPHFCAGHHKDRITFYCLAPHFFKSPSQVNNLHKCRENYFFGNIKSQRSLFRIVLEQHFFLTGRCRQTNVSQIRTPGIQRNAGC